MPRKPRIEYKGAFYHVITRGSQKQKIFKSPADYQKYIRQLSYYKTRYHCAIYAFVLMSNHVHILIETKDAPLSKVFQGINQSYNRGNIWGQVLKYKKLISQDLTPTNSDHNEFLLATSLFVVSLPFIFLLKSNRKREGVKEIVAE